MKIKGSAISSISIPSPKYDPFCWGPKRKLRSIGRALSSPIRRMSWQLSKRSSKNIPTESRVIAKSSKNIQTRDVEQGWIAQSATFETEDTVSPRSFDSLTTSDSNSLSVQTESKDRSAGKSKPLKSTSKHLQKPKEQGWIATSTTFETEDTLSPRSFDSLTTGDSASLLVQTEEKGREEEEDDDLIGSILDSSQKNNHDQFLDLEAGVNESTKTTIIFRTANENQQSNRDTDFNMNIKEDCVMQNGAPKIITNIEEDVKGKNERGNGQGAQFIRDNVFRKQAHTIEARKQEEEPRDSMVSLLSIIDTTEVIEEAHEINSLVPAADISFFLDEKEGDDFRCVGRLSTHNDEVLPLEIDVDSIDEISKNSQTSYDEESTVEFDDDSICDLSNNSHAEEKNQELYIEDFDEILSTSSYNSYLQAVENVSASTNNKIERVTPTNVNETEIDTVSFTTEEVEYEPEPESHLQAVENMSASTNDKIERITLIDVDETEIDEISCTTQEVENESDAETLSGVSSHYCLQDIESIAASANIMVERAITMAMDESEEETISYFTQELDCESEPENDEEEDFFCVSFNPSRELLLQAMEGASAKAQADIERATALAITKMNSSYCQSSKRKMLKGRAPAAKYGPNRVWGFFIFLFFLFNFDKYSYRNFFEMQPIPHPVSVADFQIQVHNDIFLEPHSDSEMWEDKQMVAEPNKTEVAASKNEHVFNIGCANKIGCLALGMI